MVPGCWAPAALSPGPSPSAWRSADSSCAIVRSRKRAASNDEATMASPVLHRREAHPDRGATMSVHILHVVEAFAAGTFGIVSQMASAHARDGRRVSLAYSLREETPADWREPDSYT